MKQPNKQKEQYDEKMEQFNKHYPVDYVLTPPHTWKSTCTDYVRDIKENLALAKIGYAEAESKLCDKLGTIRRSVEYNDLSKGLFDAMDEAINWLLSVGYKFNFVHPDPGMWITTRDGKPRF
jgi:hypothetical protein